MRHPDNAVTTLAEAVARIGRHEWPVQLTPTMEVLLGAVAELAGTEATPDNAEELVEEFGSAARMLGAVIRHTTNPTMLDAGYKVNVVPGRRHRPGRRPVPARLRGRLPGHAAPSWPARAWTSTGSPRWPGSRRRTTASWPTR